MNDQQRHSKEVLKRSKLCLLPGRFVPAIHGLALAMGCCVGLAMSTKSLAADQSSAVPLWEIGGFALAVS
ncbi:MAG: hypothetical protein EBX44_15315, partial [Betaproteobacteria bacterium]|nr:hypothetical protein [Betaproteobacteria bacterium]